jgi:predicted Zn-dependent protease
MCSRRQHGRGSICGISTPCCISLPSSTTIRQACNNSLIGPSAERTSTSRSTGKPARLYSLGSGVRRRNFRGARLIWPRAAKWKKSRGAVLGDCQQAKATAAQGLKLARERASLLPAALALALCGELRQAQPLVDELDKLYPEDTLLNSLWLPVIRAAIELQRGNATQSIEQLQTAARYEAAAEFWPQYLRAQAYLKLGRGAEASREFQQILAQRGQAPLSAIYPLAYVGLARAAALAGEWAQSRQAQADFLALWKQADPDLPPLIEAKRAAEQK